MTVTVNGTKTELPEGSSLYDLILLKRWRHVRMHIRVDGTDVPDSEYAGTILHGGQDVKIIPQFGGG